jgi:DNA/RNA-binding domain of Phe-tRNA-synthetase-like protein
LHPSGAAFDGGGSRRDRQNNDGQSAIGRCRPEVQSPFVQVLVAAGLQPIVRLGVLTFEQLAISMRQPGMDAPLAAAEAAVRAHPPEESAAVRTMYRRTGLDPTKRRPSSEALLRRVRKGEALPRINSLVDVCNWCSLEFQLPYGLYDLDRVSGDVVLRLGEEGESYPGIRKDAVHVAGRMTLADEKGPFGNPSSDSARTMVTEEATRALMIVFAPAELPLVRLEQVLELSSSRTRAYCGGTETSRQTVCR